MIIFPNQTSLVLIPPKNRILWITDEIGRIQGGMAVDENLDNNHTNELLNISKTKKNAAASI